MNMGIEFRSSETVDFKRLIGDVLATRKLSRNELAKAANMPRTSLYNYEKGMTPPHPIGERLIAEWCRCFGMARDKVPCMTEPRPPTASHLSDDVRKWTTRSA